MYADELARKLQLWVAGRSKEEGKEEDKSPHTPFTRSLLGGLSASWSAAQAYAQQPAPPGSLPCMLAKAWPASCSTWQPMPPESSGRSQLFPDYPATSSRSSSACSSGASAFANPKAVHLEAKHSACGCRVWFCGQSKLCNGFSVSVSFYTKGTNCCIHPLY